MYGRAPTKKCRRLFSSEKVKHKRYRGILLPAFLLADIRKIAQALDVPALAVECERAVRQVTQQLHTKAEKVAQAQRINEVNEEVKEEDKVKKM